MAQGTGILEREKQNICTYVENNLDTFAERPLCEVDSLVLSWFSNFRLEALGEQLNGWDITSERAPRLRDALRAECFDGLFDLWDPESCKRLLQAMAASPRFRDIRVGGFRLSRDTPDEGWPKQFAAVTLLLDDGAAYLAFRGTDATFDGWREDFNMTFARPVPAQAEAFVYLLDAAQACPAAPLVLGGHSKGGNLAAYVASTCSPEVASRLERVFSHDGPGFTAESLAASSWRERARLVSKTVPRSSLIGMLFEQQEEYSVVDSSTVGILQHDPFSWVVEGCDFVRVKGIARGAAALDETLNQWISSMTVEEREGFVNTLFSVLYASGEDTFASMAGNLQTTLPAMLDSLAATDPEERRYLTRAVSLLLRAFVPEVSLPEVTLPEVALPESLAALQSEGTALLARARARAEGAVGADATQVAGTSGATDDA